MVALPLTSLVGCMSTQSYRALVSEGRSCFEQQVSMPLMPLMLGIHHHRLHSNIQL